MFSCGIIWITIFIFVLFSYSIYAEKHYFGLIKYLILIILLGKITIDWYDIGSENILSAFLGVIIFGNSLINFSFLELFLPILIY